MRDKALEQLLYITGQSHANTSALSSNFGKKRLIDDLLLDVKKINVDEASLVKIKIWLESHKKQLELEYHLHLGDK